MITTKVSAGNLRLADTVRLFDDAWGCAIVQQIRDGKITFFRPYGTTADFSCTSGVICFIGIETVVYNTDTERQFEVVSRKELQ
jgi:hypothetical protein